MTVIGCISYCWSRRGDSNSRPAVYKAEPPKRCAVQFRGAIVEGEVIGCGSGRLTRQSRRRSWRHLNQIASDLTMDPLVLTAFGAAAVTFMVAMYPLQRRHAGFVLAFAGGCLLSSAYGFLAGVWPSGYSKSSGPGSPSVATSWTALTSDQSNR